MAHKKPISREDGAMMNESAKIRLDSIDAHNSLRK